MGNKRKEIIKTNIQYIREKFGYTQKEMGEILKVDAKTIRNYEYFETNLPIEKAVILSKRFGYLLDQIYRKSSDKKRNSETVEPKQISRFNVDIRDFVSRSDNKIHIAFPDYYWNYIKQRNALSLSNLSQHEMESEIAKLDALYKKDSNSVYYRISIPESDFLTFLRFDDSFIPYVDSAIDSSEENNPTEEQKREFDKFLNSLFD